MLAVTRDGAPDYLAVLLDLSTPEQDSIDALRQIRAHRGAAGSRSAAAPPIILMASSSRDRRLDAVSALFESFLIKPTTATSLFVEIAPFLGVGDDQRATAGKVAAPEASGEQPALKGVEALLVDDVQLNQEVIRDMLESAGMRVRVVGNGLEAIEAIGRQLPDCVIMDCQMPVMDGYEATRRIRQDERYRKLPIIALTANALPTERERCREAGMDAYITKPVRSAELLAVLAEQLPKPVGGLMPAPAPEVVTPAAALSLPLLPGIDTRLGVHYANGKTGLYLKLLDLFLDSHGRDFRVQFPAACAAGDVKTATRLVHSLKGAAMMIGAAHLSDLAKNLEDACRDGLGDSIAPRRDVLLQELEMVCAGLAARSRT